MKTFKSELISFFLFFIISVTAYGQSESLNNKILSKELAMLIGEWEGTLTYLDYSTNKPFTMPANLKVEAGKNEFEFKLYNSFPNEPKANNSSKLKIAKDGSKIDGKEILTRDTNAEGLLIFEVEFDGKDGNEGKKARIKEVYSIGNDTFSIRKEIRYLASQKWILRNEFSYNRKE